MAEFKSHPTPNPNSLKITRRKGSFIESGLLAYASPGEAASNPLARALFSLDGVINVLILPDFITVTKDTSAAWRDVWTQVEKVLEAHYA